MLHPVDIERCEGCIRNTPQKIRFYSQTDQNVKHSHWKLSKKIIGLALRHPHFIDHIYVCPILDGLESIRTQIEVRWKHPKKNDSVTIDLDLTASKK